MKFVAITLALSIVVSGIAFQFLESGDEDEVHRVTQAIPIPRVGNESAAEEVVPPSETVAEVQTPAPESAPVVTMPTEPVAVAPVAPTPPPVVTFSVTTPPVAAVAPEPVKETKPAPKTKPVAPAVASAKPKHWLQEQKAAHFTLQLTGGRNKAAIQRYIAEHKIQDQAHTLQGTRDGGVWYSVLYGSFNDRATAEAASEKLSAKLGVASRPWIRTFGSIQRDTVTEAFASE